FLLCCGTPPPPHSRRCQSCWVGSEDSPLAASASHSSRRRPRTRHGLSISPVPVEPVLLGGRRSAPGERSTLPRNTLHRYESPTIEGDLTRCSRDTFLYGTLFASPARGKDFKAPSPVRSPKWRLRHAHSHPAPGHLRRVGTAGSHRPCISDNHFRDRQPAVHQ